VGSAAADLGRATYSYVLLPCGRAGMAAASFVVQVASPKSGGFIGQNVAKWDMNRDIH